MDMDQAAVFLAGSILTALGFLVAVACIVAINNILHKYWKPVRIFSSDSFSPFQSNSRFGTEEELARISPHLEETSTITKNSK
jgi:hypothetical protein